MTEWPAVTTDQTKSHPEPRADASRRDKRKM